MGVEIRSAVSADIDAIQRIADRAWHAAHGPIIGTDAVDEFLEEYYDKEAFHSLIENDATIVDVAVDSEDGVVGFVSASPSEECSTVFDLGRIYVSPDRWREGIGQRCLDHAEQEIRGRGGATIRLGVMAENERAVNFYESSGYTCKDEFYDERVDTDGYNYIKKL